MDQLNESNSSLIASSGTKDSSSATGSSQSSQDFTSDGTTDEYFPYNNGRSGKDEYESKSESDEYEKAVPGTSKGHIRPFEKIAKSKEKKEPTKKYQEKKNEIREIGIKVDEVKEWIEKKILVPGSPRKDRNYTAPYWKTCMRFLYWVNDRSLFEDWYHCIICGWTHNVILFGGSKVVKSHAESHNIEKKYEFTRQELAELLADASIYGQTSVADFDKLLPSADDLRIQGPSQFWKSVVSRSNQGMELCPTGTNANIAAQTDAATALSSSKCSSRSKGKLIRDKANEIANEKLVESQSDPKVSKEKLPPKNAPDQVLRNNSTEEAHESSSKNVTDHGPTLVEKSTEIAHGNELSEIANVTEIKENRQEKEPSKNELIRNKANGITESNLGESQNSTVTNVLNTGADDELAKKMSKPSCPNIQETNIPAMPKSKKEKALKKLFKKNYGKLSQKNVSDQVLQNKPIEEVHGNGLNENTKIGENKMTEVKEPSEKKRGRCEGNRKENVPTPIAKRLRSNPKT